MSSAAEIPFGPFSDALMASLASRPHDWIQWQILEEELLQIEVSGEEGRPRPFRSLYTTVWLHVYVPQETKKKAGAALLKLMPGQSPSAAVSRALRQAAQNPLEAKKIPDWSREPKRPAASGARDYSDEEVLGLFEKTRALIKDCAGPGVRDKVQGLHLLFESRRKRVRNSRGLSYQDGLPAFEVEARIVSGAGRERPLHLALDGFDEKQIVAGFKELMS